MIRLLTFTNLYPSNARPRHGIFVEQRLRRLVESGRVHACVVVPVPHTPWDRRVPTAEPADRYGIPVRYCRFPVVRGLTTVFHPRLMAHAARRAIDSLRSIDRDFDLIDAHFLYPDGVAAAHLAESMNCPFVMTARGSDVNVALDERLAGRSIRWAAQRAAAIISVSAALKDRMVELGLPGERITVLRNGVDLELFRPGDRVALRVELEIAGPTLLSVGNLVEEKGHDLLLSALTRLSRAQLIVIGSGPRRGSLQELSNSLGVADRVRWIEPVAQETLAKYYSASDLTVLASTREGMPNVLLESLACGTPVVATAVGGAPEIVTDSVAGSLVRDRSPETLASACTQLLDERPDRAAVRRFGERFGWAEPIAGQLELFDRVVGRA